MSYIDPDRHLNPPEPKTVPEREWEASFGCSLGDGELEVNVYCAVTINDEIDMDSLSVTRRGVDITDILTSELRQQITGYFERNFEDIKRDCY
jgi:hypothetical protein